MSQPEKNYLDLFRTSFEIFSYNNQLYSLLCAHVLLGQVLRNIKLYFGPIYIDARVSLFFMQPSGTGKSTPVDFIGDIAKKSGLKMGDIDEISDAALVGHVDDEEVIDPETRVKTVTHNVVKGKLSEYDLLHYDEGKMLLTKSSYAQNALTWFQKALNPIGSGQNLITKNLKHGEISFHPFCSLLITTHDIENLLPVILDTGFFQRVMFYPRYVTIPERKRNEMIRCDRFGNKIWSELDVEEIAKKLTLCAKEYQNYEVKVSDNARPLLRQGVESHYRLIESANEHVKEIVATFVPRYNNLMYILSVHHSCVNFKKEIDIADAKYGMENSFLLLKDVIAWVEENINITKLTSRDQQYLIRAYQIYKVMEKDEHGYVHLVPFLRNCSEQWRLSMQSVNRRMDRFKGYGKVKQIKVNNQDMIKIEL